MRAAVLRAYGEPLDVTDVEAPDPDPDGAVVAVEACGVCRSDWHAWHGHGEWIGSKPPLDFVLGHEPAGRVVAVGDDVERVSEGDRVAVPFNLGDGSCPMCRRGHTNVCENIKALGFTAETPGAFAEEVHVPNADTNAVTLPDGVSFVDMASLGCRFVTAFHALAHRADVSAGDWVSVHGCGGVGLSAVHIADALGANVVAVDLKDEKLDKAESLGADATVRADETEAYKAVMSATDGGAHVSMDALGIAETTQQSVRSTRVRGTHVQVGLTGEAERGIVDLPTDLMTVKEVSFVGSHGMPATRYDELFRMVETGAVDPGAVVSETIGLDDVTAKLQAMTDYDTVGIPVVTEFA